MPHSLLFVSDDTSFRVTLFRVNLALVLLLASCAGVRCEAGIIVDQTQWGNASTTGTLAWAIAKANATPGADVIDINLASGTQININSAVPVLSSFISEITETLTINGNGAVLWGDPAFVTSGGLIKNKYEVSEFRGSPTGTDVLVQEAFSFTKVAEGVELTVNDLSADGVNGFVQLEKNAVANLTNLTVKNTVPYGYGSRSVVDASDGSVANLKRVRMERINMLEQLVPDAEYAWVGAIAGQNATLNMEESILTGSSSSVGGVNWLGGTANIVSSIFDDNAGGLSITDTVDQEGVLNVTNSLFRMDGSSGTSRIQAALGGEANIVASTIQAQTLLIDDSNATGYTSSGVPLRAFAGGAIHLQQSVVSLLNHGEFGVDNDPAYDSGPLSDPDLINTPGSFTADAATYVSPTSTQSLADLQSLFGQSNLLTGPAFHTSTFSGIELYLPLPQGANPIGSLIDAVTDANGSNQLINPIDGSAILFDVYGNHRTTNGFRDAGAVQHVPEPGSFAIWSLAGLVAVRRRRRS